MKDTLSLKTRVQQFTDIISASVFTDKNGDEFTINTGISKIISMLNTVKHQQSSLYILGNGGSSAVASHMANDFCNTAGLRANTINDPALLTCYTNDYGYDNAYSMILSRLAHDKDVLIAISSSGASKNILNAVKSMQDKGGVVITLSGFSEQNKLRTLGDLNIWLNTEMYGLTEVGHLFILHYVADRFAVDRVL